MSVRPSVRPSVGPSVRPSVRRSVRPSGTLSLGGQKQRRRTTYAVYPALLKNFLLCFHYRSKDTVRKSSRFKGEKKKRNMTSLEFCMKVLNGYLEKVVQVVGADF